VKLVETGKIVAVLGHGTSEKFAMDDICDRMEVYASNKNIDLKIIKSKAGYWVWRYDIG